MIETAFWTIAAWLSTSAAFGGIPVVFSLRADARAAGTSDVIRKRFAILRARKTPFVAELAGRKVWVESWSFANGRRKRWGRIAAIRERNLILAVDGVERVFAPRRESRGFANGDGAATGTFDDERALVIV